MATDLMSLINVQSFVPKIPVKWIVWGFTIIALLLVFYRMWRPKFYPILAGIKRKVGNGTVKYFDDAIIEKIDGTKQLYVYKLNRYWPVPENKYFYPCRMGFFKKWYIDLYLDSNDEIVPNEFVETTPKIDRTALQRLIAIPGMIAGDIKRATLGRPPKRALNPDGTPQIKAPVVMLDDKDYVATLVPKRREMELWGQLQRKRVADRFNNDFMTKYGFIVGQGMVVILIIGVTMIMMNKQVEIAEILNRGYTQAITVLQAMGRA